MLLSTFELLFKPVPLASGEASASEGRLLQGYFLTLANPNPVELQIRLQFNATMPSAETLPQLVIGNTLEAQDFTALSATGIYELTLPALSTRMVILQPGLANLNDRGATEIEEVRGYVEIFVIRRFQLFGFPSSYPLLVTPEHRGTILSAPLSSGQRIPLVYSLPTTCNSSLLNIESVFEPYRMESSPIMPGLQGLISRPLFSPNQSGKQEIKKPIKNRQRKQEICLDAPR